MRLIKSDKVIPLVRLILMNHPKADAICENMQELVDIHTIEAEPVKHGRWIKRPDERICPFCNDRHSYFGGKEKNYCPNCGAKMDGGAENE